MLNCHTYSIQCNRCVNEDALKVYMFALFLFFVLVISSSFFFLGGGVKLRVLSRNFSFSAFHGARCRILVCTGIRHFERANAFMKL